MKHLPEGINYEEYLRFLGELESENIRSIDDESPEDMAAYIRETHVCTGDKLPYPSTHDKIGFRPGEITLWSGVNKHGKSKIISNAVANWVCMGVGCLQLSLEMPFKALAKDFYKQATGKAMPSQTDIEDVNNIHQHYQIGWCYSVYDSNLSTDKDRVFGVIAYAVEHMRIKHAVIDSLVKCKLPMGDAGNQAQRDFADQCSTLSKMLGIHIHVVHHMRKGSTEDIPGNKFDVKGAGELADLFDNICLVWRNKPKERELREIECGSMALAECEHYSEPDTVVTVAGQRHFSWEGQFGLWFDKDTGQFGDEDRFQPMPLGRGRHLRVVK